MKKILLSILVIFIAIGGYSQQIDPSIQGEEFLAKAPTLNLTKNNKANQSTNWYNYFEEIQNVSSAWVQFLDYLFPDSTVAWVGTTDKVFVWKNSQGQVLDPTSVYFLFNANSISKSANYTLDSIAIPYAYRRTQSLPDTLLIQVFKTANMGYVKDPTGWTDPRSYCRPLYDPVAIKGIDATKEIKVVLTQQDTAVNFSRTLYQDIGVTVAPDEEIAVTVHYIPGNPYSTGDTLSRTIDGPGVINNFAMYNGRDESKADENDHYNHSLMITKSIAHNVNGNGWNGRYYPGVAYTSGIYHSDIYFQITYDDFTGISNEESNERLEVYPNPASNEVTVEYTITHGNQAILEFNDILGNKVFEKVLDVNGTQSNINVSDWNKGVYFYTLKVDGNILGTARLVVTE